MGRWGVLGALAVLAGACAPNRVETTALGQPTMQRAAAFQEVKFEIASRFQNGLEFKIGSSLLDKRVITLKIAGTGLEPKNVFAIDKMWTLETEAQAPLDVRGFACTPVYVCQTSNLRIGDEIGTSVNLMDLLDVPSTARGRYRVQFTYNDATVNRIIQRDGGEPSEGGSVAWPEIYVTVADGRVLDVGFDKVVKPTEDEMSSFVSMLESDGQKAADALGDAGIPCLGILNLGAMGLAVYPGDAKRAAWVLKQRGLYKPLGES